MFANSTAPDSSGSNDSTDTAVLILFIITAVLDLSVVFPTILQAYVHYYHFCVERRSHLYLCYVFIVIEKSSSGIIQTLFIAPISATASNAGKYWLGVFELCCYVGTISTIVLTWTLIICSMKFKMSMRKTVTTIYWAFNITNFIAHFILWFVTPDYWNATEYVTIVAVVIMLVSLVAVYVVLRMSLRKSVQWGQSDRALLRQLDRLTMILLIVSLISLAFLTPTFSYSQNSSKLIYQVFELFEHLAGCVVDCTVLYILYFFARNSTKSAENTRSSGYSGGSSGINASV